MGIFNWFFGKKDKPVAEMDEREKIVKLSDMANEFAKKIKEMVLQKDFGKYGGDFQRGVSTIINEFYSKVKELGFDQGTARGRLAAALKLKGINPARNKRIKGLI